jgi:hypothetical protein
MERIAVLDRLKVELCDGGAHDIRHGGLQVSELVSYLNKLEE